MKEKLDMYYDEEGDYLEINLGKCTTGQFRERDDGILERIDKRTGEIKGIGIVSFTKWIKQLKDRKFSEKTDLAVSAKAA